MSLRIHLLPAASPRLWECMCQADEDVYGYIMQQADVSALRLLEALVVTLPETLLHTYVLICTDIGIKSPGKRGKKNPQNASEWRLRCVLFILVFFSVQPRCVLPCVCCLWPGPWSFTLGPVRSSDQGTSR